MNNNESVLSLDPGFKKLHLTPSNDSLNARHRFHMNMFQLTETWREQHIKGLEENLVNRITSDQTSIKILNELNWCSMKKGELLIKIPGCDDSLSLLKSSGIVCEDNDILRISEPYQGFGVEIANRKTLGEILSMDKKSWFTELGFLSIYIIDSLLELLFGIEPEWEGDSRLLAHRAGFINNDGSLSDKGKDCSIALFSIITEVFDKNEVDIDDMLRRWSRLLPEHIDYK